MQQIYLAVHITSMLHQCLHYAKTVKQANAATDAFLV